ncbi:MAG: hypothetical protein EPN94_08965 [Nitrospirae bacterium]|nr:MAG: hypothetical protein EPN94_08965 [Nitrospirota bacterium]
MSKKSNEVHIIIAVPPEFNTDITADGKTYHVQTEHGDAKNPSISTHIYHKGEVVYSKKTEYSDILNAKDYNEKLRDLMERQHKSAAKEFTGKFEEKKKKAEYFDIVKTLLRSGNNKQALRVLQEGYGEFPEDPFIMSYYGCLTAVVEKKFDDGINLCLRALEKFDTAFPQGEKSVYAALYLNLGRAYLAGDRKEQAIETFNDGLKFDKKNHELLWELKKLGTRKNPPLPFLSRSNPINKYIGLMRSRLKGR